MFLSEEKYSEAIRAGVKMTGTQIDLSGPAGQAFLDSFADESVDWTDERLAKITRLRLLSDPGFPAWDVSYCWGVLKDGTNVRVSLPFDQLPKSKWGQGGIQKAIIAHAKRDGVYAKGLGIFDAISTLC